jgi:hypothetical protein
MMNYIIGCGGVGTLLMQPLVRSIKDGITIVDGDKFEKKNLDRQIFNEKDIGKNKAEAMASLYPGVKAIPEYFHTGMNIPFSNQDTLWCCADNHAARKAVLETCDNYGCIAIIGANEYMDAEAYYYEKRMRGTENDPRIFYPDILDSHAGDPLSVEGCIQRAIENPQHVIANNTAADLMLQLHRFYTQQRPNMPDDTRPLWPVHHLSSIYRTLTHKIGDKKCQSK